MKTRHEKLLAFLEQRGEEDLETMVRELSVSEATVRRDLNELAAAGRLVRTFGGARLLDSSSLIARTFDERRQKMRAEKERIALRAAEMVKPGMVVALDSGTTVWRVAAALKDKSPLTVLTNALAAVEELGSVPGISVYCAGGYFRLSNLEFIGPNSAAAFANFHADVAFHGADSLLPGKGIFGRDQAGAVVSAGIGACADRHVVVLDHSKINATAPFLILPAARIDCLITDTGLSEQTRKTLQGEPYETVVV